MKILFLIISLFISQTLYGDALDRLKSATIIADSRLSDNIFFNSIESEKDFKEQAEKQIEFALISLNSDDLLTEDWVDLSLYCLARKYKYYNLAIHILKKEFEIEKYPRLNRWIKSRILVLTKANFYETAFSISDEFTDFRQKVF